MTMKLQELRQLIAKECDRTKPLRVVAHDVGKKADRHSTIRVDEDHPATLKVSIGEKDERAVIEFKHNAGGEVFMPKDALEAIDALLKEEHKIHIGWIYFFYFPAEYKSMLGRTKRIEESALDACNVDDIYMADGEPNTLVFEAEYNIGSFD